VLAEGEREERLMPIAEVGLTGGGQIGYQVENSLAATAVAWALDVPWERIQLGLETFAPDAGTAA
jgi:cyanophycin synthetase